MSFLKFKVKKLKHVNQNANKDVDEDDIKKQRKELLSVIIDICLCKNV